MEILPWQESTLARSSSVVIIACNTCCSAVIFKGINFNLNEMSRDFPHTLSHWLPDCPRRDSRGLSGTAYKFLGGQSCKKCDNHLISPSLVEVQHDFCSTARAAPDIPWKSRRPSPFSSCGNTMKETLLLFKFSTNFAVYKSEVALFHNVFPRSRWCWSHS